ncbi:MAG: hypothetical protein KAT32_01120 [Candidatus Moranbacteria bacterium]|nr:hypothetical protein [Candidatus Moranbacteria bacterium]
MKIKKQKTIKVKKGFSIGEVLLALFVLAFGIMTSVYLMAGSMQDTMRSRDLLVAAMLSQEGTELMRNIRDNNVTEKNSSTDVRSEPFTGFPSGDGECSINYEYDTDTDYNNASFLSSLNCPSSYELYFREGDNGNLFYSHEGSSDNLTKFKRKIIVGYEGELKRNIVSMVIWNRDDFPNDKSECNIGQNCMYSETILTAWINLE